MEELVFVGCSYGRFKNGNGEIIDYCHIHVLEPFTGNQSSDYHFDGMKASKYSCVSSDVFKDIPLNSKIRCFFDSKRRVSFIQPV